MSQKKSPSPPSLPPDAQREILNRLSAETRISSREIAAILERHGVCGDIDALQDAYRKRLGQRLMATIRDESGKREVLAASGGEYVIVDATMMPVCVKGVLGECFIRQRKRLFSVGFWMGIWNGTAWMQQCGRNTKSSDLDSCKSLWGGMIISGPPRH